MTTEDPIDFAIVREAKLHTVEVARALKVSRVTVSFWLNGHAQPHRWVRDRVLNFLDAVRAAVQAGHLPAPQDANRQERAVHVQRVLSVHFAGENDAS